MGKSTDEESERKALELLQELVRKKDRTIQLLEELVNWTKATSKQKVKDILEQQVSSPAQKVVYKFSDGKKKAKELSAFSGLDETTISKDWKRWARAGITEQVPARGGTRGRSIFSLEDFGIDVPDLPKLQD